ncbi:hypothetical protein CEXT_377741 [Caerostris extrusa]|uniref:Uncharacterized protein n=1 Tax=Caerostris extrusa TaxID=172846 RepID=A0AAV4S355_CAEEX|nr:hypothetical protein CEXT_377741 [Caerostris extrusa]
MGSDEIIEGGLISTLNDSPDIDALRAPNGHTAGVTCMLKELVYLAHHSNEEAVTQKVPFLKPSFYFGFGRKRENDGYSVEISTDPPSTRCTYEPLHPICADVSGLALRCPNGFPR